MQAAAAAAIELGDADVLKWLKELAGELSERVLADMEANNRIPTLMHISTSVRSVDPTRIRRVSTHQMSSRAREVRVCTFLYFPPLSLSSNSHTHTHTHTHTFSLSHSLPFFLSLSLSLSLLHIYIILFSAVAFRINGQHSPFKAKCVSKHRSGRSQFLSVHHRSRNLGQGCL